MRDIGEPKIAPLNYRSPSRGPSGWVILVRTFGWMMLAVGVLLCAGGLATGLFCIVDDLQNNVSLRGDDGVIGGVVALAIGIAVCITAMRMVNAKSKSSPAPVDAVND